ncbi:uncharacterized protein LOC126456133 [Schistocerca serialis cubense]|uniref:uncharacterized protein LOC126456133 n=1 Tax=Schistocerca serialis cubense TaxID=2023355 RepID=UPI00214F3F09|nr:uncharacterized protein LOC126456133 [Schistocerca serialis cubense]
MTCCKYVLQNIQDKISKQNTNFRRSITAEEKLCITIRFTASRERAAFAAARWCYQGSAGGADGRCTQVPPSPFADPMHVDPSSSPSPSPSSSPPQDTTSGLDVCPGRNFLVDVPVTSQARW